MSKLDTVKNAISSKFGRQVLQIQKASPTILFVGGVAGVIGTTVMACRATLKLEEVVAQQELKQSQAKSALTEQLNGYGDKDYARDLKVLKIHYARDISKLYAPSIALGVVSIAALCGSHHILTQRNVALAAAYTTVEKAFNEYRDRVINELGPEKDKEFRFGFEDREVAVDDAETGRTEVKTVRSGKNPSQYARFFDQMCESWEPNAETNLYFIQCQQNWANDRLRSRGHVFLNEVYDSLGIPRTKAGAIVGWAIGNGDNYIDFGVFDLQSEAARDFVNGREKSILLDFNVDGIVYDLIEKKN